jgi:Lhr-like helicase
MQRLGRAGRKTGVARALIYVPTDTEEEGKPLALDQTLEERLFLLGNLSLFSEGRVEPIEMKDYYPQLFAHQVISMVFREKQMDRRKIALLKAAYPFKGLQKEDVGAVLSFLEEENYLLRIDQEYRLGWKAKDRLEGAGIGDFLSVFSSSEDWTVVEGNREIGKVHAATVFHNKRKQGHEVFIQNFYLAGKAWKVLSVDAARRRISVQRAESGAKPLWLSGEDAVHPDFSEAIRRFILKPTFSPSCVWDPEVQDTLLKTIAGELYTVSHEERWVPVMVERKKGADIHLYTYAGTLLNDLLALLVRQYAPQSRDVRSTWRVIRWKAYAPFHPEEFKDWITSLSYEEFYGLTEDEFTRNEPKFYGKVFPDCLREYIPASLSVNALIRHYWGLLQSSVRSGGLTSDA